MMITGI